ncbi:MAG: hypothetical protein AAB255_00285 [Bacteroidota bacterium]
MKKIFLLFLIFDISFSHDVWLGAKKINSDSIKILPLISINFPKAEIISNHSRFHDFKILSSKDFSSVLFLKDSLSLGIVKTDLPIIVSCNVEPRDLTFPTKTATHYLKGEVGLSKKEIANFLKNQKDSITENYRRSLKMLLFSSTENLKDTSCGLEREIVLSSFKVINKNSAEISLQILKDSEPNPNCQIRILEGKKSRLIKSDENGFAKTTIKLNFPILISYIDFWQEESGNFKSIWTNLSLVKIP